MLIVGLSGSIGMGKSTAALMLRRMGVPVYDADAAVHALTAKNGPALAKIAQQFPGVVAGGVLDRQKLGKEVFGNPKALRRLEAILHPMVQARQRRFLRQHAYARTPLVVLDIPLLYEGNGDKRVDASICVSAPSFLQHRRVMARPGMTEEKLRGILAQQMPDGLKRRRATFVVPTGQGKAVTWRKLAAVLKSMRGRSGSHWPSSPWRDKMSLKAVRRKR
ncbi:MAG: dephospho-CoA kinase [Rhodospirillales bacterium]